MEHCAGLYDIDLCGCMSITNEIFSDLQRILMDDRRSLEASQVNLSLGGECDT